jgi:trehalose 6-phosphate synthase/phosphatase
MCHSCALRILAAPAGVNPSRYLSGFSWDDFKWRRGELLAQFAGLTVLVGVDDMDVFKGIELKLQVNNHDLG